MEKEPTPCLVIVLLVSAASLPLVSAVETVLVAVASVEAGAVGMAVAFAAELFALSCTDCPAVRSD